MTQEKQMALDAIEEKQKVFTDLSDKIWELAELSLKEFESAKTYCNILRELGFTVEEEIYGIKTAFLGIYGHGKPVIGILGEFDALSGLSQEAGSLEKKEVVKNGCGHGCGHNMLGAGALAAAYGVKEYLKKTGNSGTIIFYGTPGEEGGAAKAFMAKDHVWENLDVALAWHPSDFNDVDTGTCNSVIQTLYKFKGVASHAAGDPESGRSALDAVELMNVGVQYLREHMKSDARIHYSMIDGGGFSPNVVQPTASVLYMVRSILVKDANALQERVDNIAKGAALMTGTTFEKVFIDGCSNTVPNHALEKVLYKELCNIGAVQYTEEELEFAKKLRATYSCDVPPCIANHSTQENREIVEKLSMNYQKALNDFINPPYHGDSFNPGSTDVGDVSWQTPATQLHIACFPSGCPGHSWQNVSIGKTSIGHKGLLQAGKVLACTAIELMQNPDSLSEIRKEFNEATKSGYVCPIPQNEVPKAIEC